MRRGGSGCQNKNLAALLVLVAAAYSLSSAEAFAPPSNTSYRRNAVVAGGRRSASSARRRSAGGEVSALRMSAAAAPVLKAGVGAIAGAVSGGLFAGGLHAIAGTCVGTFLWIIREKGRDEKKGRNWEDTFVEVHLAFVRRNS